MPRATAIPLDWYAALSNGSGFAAETSIGDNLGAVDVAETEPVAETSEAAQHSQGA